MTAIVISIKDTLESAWTDYVKAKNVAELSGRIEDGSRAAKAWRRWLDLHTSEDQRAYLGGRNARL